MHKDAVSVFYRIFDTSLLKKGYIPIKGSNYVFAKMTGNETVGIIALLPQLQIFPAVYCGISTVYCRNMDPKLLEQQIPVWMNPLSFFYHTHYPDTWTKDIMDALSGKPLETEEKSALFALQTVEQLVLPMLEKVSDLLSAADFLIRFGRAVTENDEIPEFKSQLAEDLLCFRAGYQGDFLESLETRREYTQHRRSDAERGLEDNGTEYTDYARQMKERAARLKQKLMLTSIEPERTNANAECERRRSRNLAYLHEAGILPQNTQGGIIT